MTKNTDKMMPTRFTAICFSLMGIATGILMMLPPETMR